MGKEILTLSWKIQSAMGSSYWESRYCYTRSLGPTWLFDINIMGAIKIPILKVPLWKTYFNVRLSQDQSSLPSFVNIKVGRFWTKCTVSLKTIQVCRQHVSPVLRDGKSEKLLWIRHFAALSLVWFVVIFLQKNPIADFSWIFLLQHSYLHKAVSRFASFVSL